MEIHECRSLTFRDEETVFVSCEQVHWEKKIRDKCHIYNFWDIKISEVSVYGRTMYLCRCEGTASTSFLLSSHFLENRRSA